MNTHPDLEELNETATLAARALRRFIRPTMGPREIPSDPRTFPDAPLDPPAEPEETEEDQAEKGRRSCLPPALWGLRARIKAGELVDVEELRAALRKIRPLNVPTFNRYEQTDAEEMRDMDREDF
jgi:hypothetical protein